MGDNDLEAPLLETNQTKEWNDYSFGMRLFAAIIVLWSAAAVGSCVESIAIVWDLAGSSLSIFVSYIIPAGSYVIIVNKSRGSGKLSSFLCWIVLGFFLPM